MTKALNARMVVNAPKAPDESVKATGISQLNNVVCDRTAV